MSDWLGCQESRQTVRMTSPSTSYKDTLLAELDQIAARFPFPNPLSKSANPCSRLSAGGG